MSGVLNNPVILFTSSLCAFWVAAWVGTWFRGRTWVEREQNRDDFIFVVGGILTLLALILGFTFSMAVSRYDHRKSCEEQEANAIGTEYLRAGQLPGDDSAKVRGLLKAYLDQRIRFYLTGDADELRQIKARTDQLQVELWSSTSTWIGSAPPALSAFVLNGMNDVFNSQVYTQSAWRNRIPLSALMLVILIGILSNMLVGYTTAHRRSTVLLLLLPIALSITLFMIADIDSPRGGYIRVRPQNLESLMESLRSR